MSKPTDELVMDELLKLYDWHTRMAVSQDDYECGAADAIGQCILDVGKALGCHKWSVKKQEFVTGYKYEAFKRVMEFESCEKYWRNYPKPLASYFPAEVIRQNGGKL